MERVFVLGLGAQKAGTTWLHQYLSSYKFANFGITKEYHIWDAVLSPWCRNFIEPQRSGHKVDTARFLRHCMQNIDGFYEDYFASILHSGYRLTGDITPSYSALDATQLQEVRRRLSRIDARLRVVFLMRDPFERCWSAVRMAKRDKTKRASDEEALRTSYFKRQFLFRTQYEIICEDILKAFPSEDVHFGLYENMFDQTEVDRLSRFIGVKPKPALTEQRANPTVKTEQISDALRQEVRAFYAETYRYCGDRFPETRKLWAKD